LRQAEAGYSYATGGAVVIVGIKHPGRNAAEAVMTIPQWRDGRPPHPLWSQSALINGVTPGNTTF